MSHEDDITKPTDTGALPTAEINDPTPAAPTLLEAAAAYAIELARLGIRETSRNSSPEIDRWLGQVFAKPGDSWCAAFVYEVFRYASRAVGVPNPCPRTAGALRMWALAEDRWKIGAGVAMRNPELLRVGQVFTIDHGEGKGHTGLIVGHPADLEGVVLTVEGNTNAGGSREGDGVYSRSRSVSTFLGVIDFGR